MNELQIAVLALYVIGVIVVAVGAWKVEFHDHRGDPLMASVGLSLSVLIGGLWPILLALAPAAAGIYAVGKLIVRKSDG